MPLSPIKVLLVEDSPVALEILQRILKSSPNILVVGTARNGKEALEIIPKLKPNVICTDLHMSKMDGLELIKQVMAKYPTPILVISNAVQTQDSSNIFALLQAGAVDIFAKPPTGLITDYEQAKDRLINKIQVVAGVSVFTKPLAKTSAPVQQNLKTVPQFPIPIKIDRTSPIKVVTIGSSTGGPQALQKILTQLPKHFPVPIICTQHISKGFLPGLVDWLHNESQVTVKIAQEGELLLPGTVYFAPDGTHLALNSLGRLTHINGETVDGHCPSVTVMFKSVVNYYGKGTLGVLLTGMGKDGATGMKAIREAGGVTIAQDEITSIVFGMPKEAITLGAVEYILPIQEIAPLLEKICIKKDS